MRMPTSLTLPENVWIFGAVNMDETTHQLSPKVLDRVHVLRFGNPMLADWDAIEDEIDSAAQDHPADLPRSGSDPTRSACGRNIPFSTVMTRACSSCRGSPAGILDPLGVEFGMRAIRQAQGYLAADGLAGLAVDEALDDVIKHKILPKMAFDAARSCRQRTAPPRTPRRSYGPSWNAVSKVPISTRKPAASPSSIE